MKPFESRMFYIHATINSPADVNPVNIGDILTFTASINPSIGDETQTDNSFIFNQTVVGAYDPNIVTCLEGTEVSDEEIGNYLHYTVDFENTGNYPAENIVVKEILDETKYDINTLQILNSSNPMNVKITGNKTQLISRIYSYLYLSCLSIRVQKIIRGCLQRKYNNIHGPGFKKKELCTNNFDFLSMDEVKNIPNEQFFSFKDEDGFIYGFDILSLHNLIYKCNGVVKNPFNQKQISSTVIENFRSLLRLSRVLKINIITEISDVTKEVSDKKSVELRALALFQNIDSLGNYSNAQWFLTLNRNLLIKFIRELVDIWQYRANLSNNTKKDICPPMGNPFAILPNYTILQNLENLDDVRKILLEIMEKFVNSGINKDNKCLGAYYVLGAITLVNNEAATSLPWLYEASYHM